MKKTILIVFFLINSITLIFAYKETVIQDRFIYPMISDSYEENVNIKLTNKEHYFNAEKNQLNVLDLNEFIWFTDFKDDRYKDLSDGIIKSRTYKNRHYAD